MYLTRELKSHFMEVSIYWIWIWIWILSALTANVARIVTNQRRRVKDKQRPTYGKLELTMASRLARLWFFDTSKRHKQGPRQTRRHFRANDSQHHQHPPAITTDMAPPEEGSAG